MPAYIMVLFHNIFKYIIRIKYKIYQTSNIIRQSTMSRNPPREESKNLIKIIINNCQCTFYLETLGNKIDIPT